jgi:alpha,alpha-trehalose-phosphate synthase [UDP-forming]
MMPIATHLLHGRTLILLSNREPYEHVAADDGVDVRKPAGGLVSALDPTLQRTHGTWVAWGSGTADRENSDAEDRVQVPPDDPSYTLRRVWLDEADVDGYYLGFANSALWPLCHMLIQHFEFRMEHWERYRDVNARFADAVADEAARAAGQPVIWIQDYHFGLVAGMLRERLARDAAAPDAAPLGAFIHQFWHIPFPPPDILRLLPSEVVRALLQGLLGNDLIEFHTDRYASNFFDCVAAFVPAVQVRREHRRVHVDGRIASVGAFPISIDVERFERLAHDAADQARALREQYAVDDCQLGVSVDRVDYTKGIPERLRALDRLWTEVPELCGRFTFLLVATPSRSELASYKSLEEEVVSAVEAINARHGRGKWTPIVLVHENVDAARLAGVYRAADLCLVSSLQDGMNLVAKEFVACQLEEQGVLVLSKFTGAAEEIEGAVLINPFNVDGFVGGLRSALEMGADERRRRMRAMREQLHRSTIFDWLDAILARVDALAAPAGNGRRAPRADDVRASAAPAVPTAPGTT